MEFESGNSFSLANLLLTGFEGGYFTMACTEPKPGMALGRLGQILPATICSTGPLQICRHMMITPHKAWLIATLSIVKVTNTARWFVKVPKRRTRAASSSAKLQHTSRSLVEAGLCQETLALALLPRCWYARRLGHLRLVGDI